MMVRSATRGAVVFGRGGVRYLDEDRVEGDDPTTLFGPHTIMSLKHEDGMVHAPDLLFISQYDPDMGEVAAFEEQIGSHGGLGGFQTQPFILHPVDWELDEPVPLGAPAIYRNLRRWLSSIGIELGKPAGAGTRTDVSAGSGTCGGIDLAPPAGPDCPACDTVDLSRTLRVAAMTDVDERLITGETVVRSTSKHWIAPLGDSKWAILMIVGALIAAWLQGDSTSGVTGFVNRGLELVRLALFLGGIAWIVYNVVAWRTAEYHVTNRRVFGTDGLVRRRQTDTLLTSIADVKTVIPWLGRMLGFGHVRIVSASGEAGADSFTNIRDVEPFKREILEQKSGVGAQGERAADAQPAAAPPPIPASPAPPSSADITATLGELARLRDAGAITADEYEAKKTELLARL